MNMPSMNMPPMVGAADMARGAIRWAVRNFREAAHRRDAAGRIMDSHPDAGEGASYDESGSIEKWFNRSNHAYNAAVAELALTIHTAGDGTDRHGAVDDDDLMRPRAVIIGGAVYATYWIDGRSDPVVVMVEKGRVMD